MRFVQVAAGACYSLALAADDRLFNRGRNSSSQLCKGIATNRLVSGTLYSLVLGQGAAVYSAVYNAYGQFGDSTTTNSLLFLRNWAPLLIEFTATPAGLAAVCLA